MPIWFVLYTASWVYRGGLFSMGTGASVFAFIAYGNGWRNEGFRVVCFVL
jgi:hypothetical protein